MRDQILRYVLLQYMSQIMGTYILYLDAWNWIDSVRLKS